MPVRTAPTPGIEHEVARLIDEGFELRQQTPRSASLGRRRRFGYGTFVALFLLGGWPGVLYIGWYLAHPEETVFLRVEGDRVVESRPDRFEGWPRFALSVLVTLAIVLTLAAAFVVSSGSSGAP